jgi:Protein of unknown function (DUF2510)
VRRWTGRDLCARAGTLLASAAIATASLVMVSALPAAGAETAAALLQSQLVNPGPPWVLNPTSTVATTQFHTALGGAPAASKVYQFGTGTILIIGLIKTNNEAAAVPNAETKFMDQICSGSNVAAPVKGLHEGVSTSCSIASSTGSTQNVNLVVGSKGSTIIYVISSGTGGPIAMSELTSLAIHQYNALPTSLITTVNISVVVLLVIALGLIVMIVRTQVTKRREKRANEPGYDMTDAYEHDQVFVGAGAVVPVAKQGPIPGARAHGSAQSQAYVANPPPGLGTYPEFGSEKKPDGPPPLPSFNRPNPNAGHTPDARARMVSSTMTIQRVEPQLSAPPVASGPNGPSPLAVGWHVDPDHPQVQNYWDGSAWTTQTQWDGSAWVTSA